MGKRFIDIRTKEIKEAYSIEVKNDKAYVKFTKTGRAYVYNLENIEIQKEEDFNDSVAHRIYSLKKTCYNCGKDTSLYTYIVFKEDKDNDVVYPWNKNRLLKLQDIESHLRMPEIEFYGLKVLGDDDDLDSALLKKYPNRIALRYSATQGRKYAMNLCEHCGAKQGWFFLYKDVNQKIKDKEEIEIIETLI